MTTPQPPDNREIAGTLVAASNGEFELGPAFYAKLRGSTLLVPVTAEGGPQMFGVPGSLAVLAFTDLDSVAHHYRTHPQLGPPPSIAAVPMLDLCRLSVEHGVRVQLVTGEVGYALGAGEVQMLIEGLVPGEVGQYRLDTEAPLRIGQPADPPPPACLAEFRTLAMSTGAERVRWFWMQIGDGQSHLGLSVTPDSAALRQTVGGVLQPVWARYRSDNPTITILPADIAPESVEREGVDLLA